MTLKRTFDYDAKGSFRADEEPAEVGAGGRFPARRVSLSASRQPEETVLGTLTSLSTAK